MLKAQIFNSALMSSKDSNKNLSKIFISIFANKYTFPTLKVQLIRS